MQLTGRAIAAGLAFGLALLAAGGATAQSLSPMRAKGPTPSLVKGFWVEIGNPYRTRMSFSLTPMEPGFVRPATGAQVLPATVTLAPGFSRRVVFAFQIPPGSKERTIGLCVSPTDIAGPVLPRVCGTYTGLLLKGAGG